MISGGLESETARAEESEAVVNWAFRQFAMRTPVKAGERVAEAEVWLGDAPSVGLVPGADIEMLVPPAMQRDGIEATVSWNGPIEAPISEGQEVGRWSSPVTGCRK